MTDLPDIDIEAERPDFERNALSRGLSVDRNDTGSYLMAVTEYRYRGWKARARIAAEREREMQAKIDRLEKLVPKPRPTVACPVCRGTGWNDCGTHFCDVCCGDGWMYYVEERTER